MTSPKVLARFIEVRDGPVYADIREGNGPALVFLHYWGGSRRTWTPVLARLDPGQAFVAYDQRGWGNSVDVPRYEVPAQRIAGFQRWLEVHGCAGPQIA